MEISIIGKINRGKLMIPALPNIMKSFPDGKVMITIASLSPATGNQKRYYYGHVLPVWRTILIECGYPFSIERTDEYLRTISGNGNISDMTSSEMGLYLTWLTTTAAELGYLIEQI